ncbi:MAG: hypothetical protein K1000chlam3_00720 [Chlamydiae bacterium]|nr:hypothetical protein [Chlamydiota bacterium]
MIFIINFIKKNVKLAIFLLFVILLSGIQVHKNTSAKSINYETYADKVTYDFIQEVTEEFGYICGLSGGSMPNDIMGISVGFDAFRKATIDEARELIILITQKFLRTINSYEEIRPYLRDYPFNSDRIYVSISFNNKKHEPETENSISQVTCTRDKIYYSMAAPKTYSLSEIASESYEEAFEIIQGKINNNFESLEKLPRNPFFQNASNDYSSELKIQSQTTPEMEEEIVKACAKKSTAPLSEALEELIRGISDETFDKDFIEKIKQAEAKKHTGKYEDYWDNGKLKIRAYFKDGKVDGHVHGWFHNGEEAFKAFFYENTKVGIHLAFYPYKDYNPFSSKIARRISYNFVGQLDREQESSDYEERLKTLIRYKHGVLHGGTCAYNQERKCVKDEFYEEGKFIPGKTTETKK